MRLVIVLLFSLTAFAFASPASAQLAPPEFVEVARVDGRILDVRPDRILYRTIPGVVAIRDRQTGQDTILPSTEQPKQNMGS